MRCAERTSRNPLTRIGGATLAAGVVGEHSDWPVERLACSADGLVLASAVRCGVLLSDLLIRPRVCAR
jgi:hypothetical protein